MAHRSLVNLLLFGNRTISCIFALRSLRTVACGASSAPTAGFKPDKVAVVTKTTRYEFEQQRYRYAGLSEEDLKQLLAMKGSSYSGLLERHNIHNNNVEHIVKSLQREGIQVRVVKRGEYNEEVVRWADAVISAGGYREKADIQLRLAPLLCRREKEQELFIHAYKDFKRMKTKMENVFVSNRRVAQSTHVAPGNSAVVSLGDGTMLLVASKVLSKDKPVVGVNTDPERSEGHLCLPVRYTRAFPEALEKLCRGEFRWLWRQRIRLHLEGTGINPTPVDLHDQQLSLEQHNRAHRITTTDTHQRSGMLHQTVSEPCLLPVRSLNEIFIGESLSSRASYYEISVDDGPWEKQKSSGLSICTGTGSKAWSYNINKLAEQAVEEVLRIGMSEAGADLPLSPEFIQKVTDSYNESLVFSPAQRRLLYSVREPIVNRVFSSSRQRGFASKVCVRSRCWDACMVVDGGTSFEFNDGAIATVSMSEEDQLRTVLLEN